MPQGKDPEKELHIREKLEAQERQLLAPWAAFSAESRGRKDKNEEEDEIRTCYMRDRDRITHSAAFRSLKHKTQVYIAANGDDFRTRLTHTLEVSQISRTIGRALGLNLDLIEAIALGHDVGHTPFSHSGEMVFDRLLPGGFDHQSHSIRVLSFLEKRGDSRGLNLTVETLDGVFKHRGLSAAGRVDKTIEGQIVRFSDKIAYVQHDIDDSLRTGVLKEEDIPRELAEVLGNTHSRRIATLVKDLIYTNLPRLAAGEREIVMSPDLLAAFQKMREFMFERVYQGEYCMAEKEKAIYVLEFLFRYFMKHQAKRPEMYREIAEKEGAERAVVDYLSSLTDHYCLALFQALALPNPIIV